MHVRRATVDDVDALVSPRLELLRTFGRANVPEAAAVTRRWLAEHLADGRFLAWVAEADGKIVGSSGFMLLKRPPYYLDIPDGVEGYILNMYTVPEWRGRGVATRIIDEILRYTREQGIRRVTLHTSEAGRRVYERAGFRATTTEMEVWP